MNTRQKHELLKAIGGLCDGTLEQPRFEQLSQQLATDAAAYRFYLEITSLELDLEWACATRSRQSPAALETTAGAAPLAAAATDTSSATEANQARASLPPLTDQRISFFSPQVLMSAVLVALCLYGPFVIMVWNLRPQRQPDVADSATGVAVVREMVNVRSSADAPVQVDRSPVRAGDLLKIDAGVIELEIKQGARLRIEGPAAWSIDDGNSATLKFGKLVAEVPRQAVGFTVQTPTARIIDLGTEFGVEVDAQGRTDVEVLRGKIELTLNSPGDETLPAGSSVNLTAGMARRVEPADKNGHSKIHPIATNPDRFVRSAPPSQRKLIRVRDVNASSTSLSGDQSAQNLINGSGMRGDRHGSLASGSMWLSLPADAKNPFVLVDLGQVYRLETLKIWNYNGDQYDAFRASGAKKVDVYVSKSGLKDPISKPSEWTLAAAAHPVAQATGMPDYSTPEAVPLPQVEARYVAIVITEAWRLAPRAAKPLFTFAAGEPKKVESGALTGTYGNEFVTAEALTVKGLGTWVSPVDNKSGRTGSDYTATLYRIDGEEFSQEHRATVPVGTAIDEQGFAFAPVDLRLVPNVRYVVVAYLGTTAIGQTHYAYGVEVGTFHFGTTFKQNRFAFSTDPAALPRSRSEDANFVLGPLLGGNLLIQHNQQAAGAAVQKPAGVGLSEVQFFGTRVEPALHTQ